MDQLAYTQFDWVIQIYSIFSSLIVLYSIRNKVYASSCYKMRELQSSSYFSLVFYFVVGTLVLLLESATVQCDTKQKKKRKTDVRSVLIKCRRKEKQNETVKRQKWRWSKKKRYSGCANKCKRMSKQARSSWLFCANFATIFL